MQFSISPEGEEAFNEIARKEGVQPNVVMALFVEMGKHMYDLLTSSGAESVEMTAQAMADMFRYSRTHDQGYRIEILSKRTRV